MRKKTRLVLDDSTDRLVSKKAFRLLILIGNKNREYGIIVGEKKNSIFFSFHANEEIQKRLKLFEYFWTKSTHI
jgi:hypothetical protein